MAEIKKQRMDPERFIEIFKRYTFEEKDSILKSLKEDLRNIENKIS